MSGGEKNPSATICLNSVAQGDGESQRDGRKMVMKYISVKGVIKCAATSDELAVGGNQLIALYLVLDTQTNATLLDSESVFVNPTANSISSVTPFRNLQFISRFKVLKSLLFSTGHPQVSWDGTNIESGNSLTPFSMNCKLNDIPVNFTGTTETIANIVDNSLHLIGYVVEIGGTASATITYNARLRFVG